jgi:hypothetical protein
MASTSSEFELNHYAQQPSTPEIEPHRNESIDEANASSALPPTDGGKDAWLFLFASFMLEALIWGRPTLRCALSRLTQLGFAASYGIFQEYYATHDFAGSSNIAVVGACAMV